MARQPTTMAMYVEARGAHWLSGSSSVLTLCMFSNKTADKPSDAPEKAKTTIRKIKGTNGFFSSNLCLNVSRVMVREGKGSLEKRSVSTTQNSIAGKRTVHSSNEVGRCWSKSKNKNKRRYRCRLCGSNTVPPECIECVT